MILESHVWTTSKFFLTSMIPIELYFNLAPVRNNEEHEILSILLLFYIDNTGALFIGLQVICIFQKFVFLEFRNRTVLDYELNIDHKYIYKKLQNRPQESILQGKINGKQKLISELLFCSYKSVEKMRQNCPLSCHKFIFIDVEKVKVFVRRNLFTEKRCLHTISMLQCVS